MRKPLSYSCETMNTTGEWRKVPYQNTTQREYQCACICGKLFWVKGGHLKRTKSCGCRSVNKRVPTPKGGVVNTGRYKHKMFGKKLRRAYELVCHCGVHFWVCGPHVSRTKCCGCSNKKYTHKFTCGTSEERAFYSVWQGIKGRVKGTSRLGKKYYADRGINMSPVWEEFENFHAHMFESYKKHKQENKTTTIERIDNNGHYTPENCRWATRKEQVMNRRTTVFIKHNGEDRPLAVWAEEKGLTKKALRNRLARGWSVERALTQPLQKRCATN